MLRSHVTLWGMQHMDVNQFLSLIMSLRARFGLSVTSWLRSPIHNTAVGGVLGSLHTYGLAVDLVLDLGESKKDFAEACKRLGLHCIVYDSHFHVQASPPPG